jgi:6-phosphogluconolactonase (cycloisomerase 2 family)
VNANNGISVFSIDASSGVLTQIAGSPFTTGSEPIRVVADPSGKFLFTANQQDKNVSCFSIDGTSGALTPVSGSPFATPAAPEAVAISADGAFLYVGASGLSAFSINGSTGALTPISGSPFSTGQNFIGLAVARP